MTVFEFARTKSKQKTAITPIILIIQSFLYMAKDKQANLYPNLVPDHFKS